MLPEGWREHELGEIATFKGGCGFKESYQGQTSGEWPFIKVSDMNLPGNEQEIFHSQNWVDRPEAKAMRASPMPPRAIVFAKVGAALMLNRRRRLTRPTIIDNNMMAAIPDEAAITSDFLFLHMKTVDLGKFAQASAVPSVNQQHLAALPIILPPLPEQRKIAEILSTWDAAIAAQERLIANARAQKKALMQTLLPTGAHPPKKRLPGFSGDWRSVCLGDIGQLRKGKGIQRDQVRAVGFPCIRYGEIYTQHHEQVRQFHSFIDAETAADSEPISAGDILFTCSGETAEEIGKCVAYLGSEKAYAGGDIIILSPTSDSAAFLGYVLNDTDVAEQKRRFGQGNSVVHISAANLSKLTFRLPSRAEQDAIASVLDDATVHIDGLAAELTTLIQEKSALMQQLLTGKRRVKLEEVA